MKNSPGISIIIPTLNEADSIGTLINYLKSHAAGYVQIIVSDGGSTDNTASAASLAQAKVLLSPKKGRAAQMNYGASFATESILYFVHADCLPPKNFYSEIIESVAEGFALGRFQTKFNSKKWLLKLNAFFTRFDWAVCSGGDQTLFFRKDIFRQIDGFNDELFLMEDYDIVKRARKLFRYAILKDKVLVSARKYSNNSWIKVQQAHHTIIKMYQKGASQKALVEKYKQLLNYRY
ncbi:MAG: TIGR04283 family arsenosugar biosynthesis glycosyltransferase [Bacteroidota bacterium]|nr:TIGR04283 family arsenosugar biosynthesis glycosyltransferase [Bacteroidota bacterium]